MPIRYVTVTPTVLNADAYDVGDVLFATTEIPLATGPLGQPCLLDSILILEGADQTAAIITTFFFDSNVTFGAADAAPSITDADAVSSLGQYAMATANYVDVGASKLAYAPNLNIPIRSIAGTRSIYFSAISAGTPTLATGSLVYRFGFKDL